MNMREYLHLLEREASLEIGIVEGKDKTEVKGNYKKERTRRL